MAGARRKLSNSIHVKIVMTHEELMHAVAVRSICFVGDQAMKASLILDDNDHVSTNIIVYDGDEPIGTARIRWFNGFAKIERASFRPEHRNPRVLVHCAKFIFKHCAEKGYDRIITHAEPKIARMWCMLLGFERVENKEPMHFIGHDEPYYEIVKYLDPVPEPVTLESDPEILFRTEGKWNVITQHETAGS